MVHFGILCPAATGHLNPMAALGYELQQRGHRVTVIGIEDVKSKVLAAGLGFEVIGLLDYPLGTSKKIFTKIGNLSGLEALRMTIEATADGAKANFRDTPKVIEAARIEFLLVDQATPEGGTIAEYMNIPFITVCNALMINRDSTVPPFTSDWNYNPSQWGIIRNQIGYSVLLWMGRSLGKIINDQRRQWNLPLYTHSNQLYSQLAQISQQPSEFEFPRKELPPMFHFTGPYINPVIRESIWFPYEKLTGQPLIYASMGTVQNQLAWIFQTIAKACMELDVQLVLALGGGISVKSLPNLPGNPIVVNYAPQLELLDKASLTITHAGMNTTLESLASGVPMIAIPITNDQPAVAARIAWTKTGEVVPLKQVKVKKLRKAIKQVLSIDDYRKNAMNLQQAIAKAGGVNRAANIIEQVTITKKTVFA